MTSCGARRRGAEPDDRSVDVLISRLRRKIETAPKTPRIIITVPGEGYKLAPKLQPIAPLVEAKPTASTAAIGLVASSARPSAPGQAALPLGRASLVRRPMLTLAAATVGLMAAFAGAAIIWGTGPAAKSPTLGSSPDKFDASIVPIVSDAVRKELASYPGRPDFKALAISPGAYGIAAGAADVETAKADAMERCTAKQGSRVGRCRIYAVGTDVLWSRSAIPTPLPADVHLDLLDAQLVPGDMTFWSENNISSIKDTYMLRPPHKALAVKSGGGLYWRAGYASGAEAARAALEACGDSYQAPCIILSVDGWLTLRIPQTRRVTDIFMLTTEVGMSEQERQRVGAIYQEKEWRALARGKAGWYPIANAPSETAAIDAAAQSCAQRDSECRLYAIGNFCVADEKLP